MNENNTSILERSLATLQKAPHVLTILIDLFLGDIPSAVEQREHVQAHLMICHFCRTAFLTFLSSMQQYHQANKLDETMTSNLLARFTDLCQKLEERESYDYERLGAYAETILEDGVKKAARQFPELTVHLALCSVCRTVITETIADFITLESSL